MPILIISKKYAKIRKFGTKISPPICNLWGKNFYKNFYFYLYILYSNLELWEKQNNFWWIRLRYLQVWFWWHFCSGIYNYHTVQGWQKMIMTRVKNSSLRISRVKSHLFCAKCMLLLQSRRLCIQMSEIKFILRMTNVNHSIMLTSLFFNILDYFRVISNYLNTYLKSVF